MLNNLAGWISVAIWVLCGSLSISVEAPKIQSEKNREQAIDQILRGLQSDSATTEDYTFLRNLPKDTVPLLILRLQETRGVNSKYNGAFDLLGFKLKQFDGEIPDEVRQAAVSAMITVCESAVDEIALMYLLGFRGLNDPEITEMAGRMKSRPDINVRKAAARLLEVTDDAPPLTPLRAPSAASAGTIATPTPSEPVRTATPTPLPRFPMVAESSAPVVERKAPLWPWLVGIVVVVVIVAVALKRRA